MRTIPDPGFSGDDGDVPEPVASALADFAADPAGRFRPTLAVLQHARVLVPVVATLGEVEYDAAGLAHDKSSDMATVLLTGRDGRQGLLAFTGLEPLRAWKPGARPVPVPMRQAAEAALADGADALVLDVAGPVVFAVEGEDLASLARGELLVGLAGGWAWVRPAG